MNTLQRKAKEEHYTIAETVASIQDARPKAFQTIVDKAAAVYLELFHQTEPNPHGDSGDLIQGRAGCWPMYRDRYTPEQTQALRIVSVCCIVDTLLTRKKILPMTGDRLNDLPFTILTRAMLYCGTGAGYTLPMLSAGIDLLATEIESAGNWDNPAFIPNSDVVKLSDERLTLSQLSKILDSGKGGIRFARKGNRCKVHIDDARWLIEKIKAKPDYFTEAAFNQYMRDAEETKKQIQKEKTRQR